MQKLDIDFQSAAGKTFSVGTAVLVLAVLVGLALLLMQRDLSDRLAAMDAAQGRTAASEKSAAGNKQKSEGDQLLQAAFNQLVLPWGEVFAAVEEATDDQVLLLTLEGDGRNRVIKIAAQAPYAEAMLAYLERLKSNGKLNGWRLLNHHEGEDGALHFVIQADLPEGV